MIMVSEDPHELRVYPHQARARNEKRDYSGVIHTKREAIYKQKYTGSFTCSKHERKSDMANKWVHSSN